MSRIKVLSRTMECLMYHQIKDFFGHVENLYWAQDFGVESLVQPLKIYHGYMVDKIAHSAGCSHLAFRVMHIVSGIFIYPLLGFGASFGVLFKGIERGYVKKHNEETKNQLKLILHKPVEVDKDSVLVKYTTRKGWNFNNVYKFDVLATDIKDMTAENKEAILNPIRGKIDELTDRHRKVYLQSVGNWAKGLSIYLALFQAESPYCDNISASPALNDEMTGKIGTEKYNADKGDALFIVQQLTAK